jgi:HSP20 family protein
MKTLIPWRKKELYQPRGNGGTPIPREEFPYLLNHMRGEFDHFFDRFAQAFPTAFAGPETGWNWGLDIQDKDNQIVIHAEAPGFEPGDFDVQISGENLILKAFKKTEKEEKKGNYRACSEHQCYETVPLPPGINKEKVEACYHNGVLTITFPKTPEARPRKVPVKNSP